jgi:geranylgeranylglycerol-phosphate geranylgeranyltransferase
MLHLIKMTRPINLAIGLGTALTAILCTSTFLPLIWIIFYCLTFVFIGAAANIHNDIIDIEIDKINRPKRPLPSGATSIQKAKIASLTLAFFSFLSSVNMGILGIVLFIFLSISLYFYNSYAKKKPLIGNLMVAFLCTTPFLSLLLWTQLNSELIFSSFFAFLFTWLREWLKDLEDFEGDRQNGAITLAVYLGIRKTLLALNILWILSIFSLSLPWIFNWFNSFFQYSALFILLPWHLIGIFKLKSSKKSLSYASMHLKLMILVGMISIIVDQIFYATPHP